jgi:hypothetical protein
LRDKAHLILSQLAQGAIDKASPQSNSTSSGKDDDQDELAIFAGRTRFISTSNKSRSPTRSPQSIGSGISATSPRRRGSESLGSSMPVQSSGRRGSEPFRYGQLPQSENDVLRQAHPTLLEYMRGINRYVPPPAVVQGVMGTRPDETSEPVPSPIHPVIKSDVQPNFTWVDPSANVPQPSSIAPNGAGVYSQFGASERQQPVDLGRDSTAMEQGGIYAPLPPTPGVMPQAVGTFGYPAELNGDGTWQQLMVQLGVMEGQN